MYRLEFDKQVYNDLKKIPLRDLESIHRKITLLKTNPRPAGVKKLKGIKNLFRLRQGDYRILYQIYDDRILIVVIAVKHRRFVYRNQ